MRNKGRRHKSGRGPYANGNCKGSLCGITRDITKMGRNKYKESDHGIGTQETKSKSNRFMKKKWSKRVRGYFKSQTKDLLNTGEVAELVYAV